MTPEFAVIRSLLHDQHQALVGQDVPFVLVRELDDVGTPRLYTAAHTLAALAVNSARGFLYACDTPATAVPFPQRDDLGERRVPEPLRWRWVASTTVEDLPDDLIVLDAPASRAREVLDQEPEPAEVVHRSDLLVGVGVLVDIPVAATLTLGIEGFFRWPILP